MSESENVITHTGRGFRATLEASVLCEAIEKSSLESSVKEIIKITIIGKLSEQGLIQIEDFTAKIYERFTNDPVVMNFIKELIDLLTNYSN